MKRIVLLILFCFGLSIQAQNIDKPKVGLVLSGGGAKGLAHIGALKTLDSLGVKVDYIAGTSMGAIVGSLYASGYTGMQLDSIFREIDFDKLIADELPRASKTFYEKENSEKYAISIPFDNFKIQIPSALSRGQNVFNLLSRLMLHVSDVDNFENLPIPFFCIATNIETGEPVILDSGSLAQAIKASGALPSLFQPVILNDQILIDGGVVNNYPIDELKAKGMDIIIGVDVQDDLATKDDLKSAPEILIQINNYRTIRDMREKSVKTDIYIKPDIREFTVVSFDEGDEIIRRGKKAALDKVDELNMLVEQKGKLIKPPLDVHISDSIQIDEIVVKGNENYTRAYVLGKLQLKKNEKISYEQFGKGVNNLVATNNFDSFLYQFRPSETGYDLLTNLKESEGSTFLKLGVHYDDLYKSAALLNLTQKRILLNNDVASLDVILGDNVRYNFVKLIKTHPKA